MKMVEYHTLINEVSPSATVYNDYKETYGCHPTLPAQQLHLLHHHLHHIAQREAELEMTEKVSEEYKVRFGEG